MRFSSLRLFQWLGVALFLVVLVGVNYDFESDAGETINAPVEDSLSQGLLGYWKMDEGTGTSTTADSSGNANTLSLTGPPTWTTGNIGPYALDFSGTAQYLSVADPASGILDFVNGASFSITGWFNRDTFAADHTIVAKKTSQSTSADAGYIVWIDNNGSADTLCFAAYGTAGYSICSSAQFNAVGWNSFAISWNDSVGVNVYINGALSNGTTSGTFSSVASLANSEAFRIGAESDAELPFDGKIDDVRIYGSALPANEISRLYQTTVPGNPIDTGLVGHWTFDGNDVNWGDTGLEIKDVSGKGNHGAVSGLTRSSVAIGKLGQGLSFDGASSYVDSGSSSSLDDLPFQGNGGMTVVAWVYSNIVAISSIVTKGYTYDGWEFSLKTNGQLFFRQEYSLNDLSCYSDSYPFYASTWRQIAVTWDGGVMLPESVTFYRDGEVLAKISCSADAEGTRSLDEDKSFRIGASSDGSDPFLGKIDDVRVYNRVLSEAEINALYMRYR